MLTVKEAIEIIRSINSSFGHELVSLDEAYGRVLAETVAADRDYPPFNRATMDGVAIKVEDFEKGVRVFEVVGNIFAGSSYSEITSRNCCVGIMTGAPVPEDLNAVIRVEDLEKVENKVIISTDIVVPFLNIARKGEDVVKDEIILNKNIVLTHSEISALAVTGRNKVLIKKRPTIAIISTGNEIKPVAETILPNQIRDSNSYAIEAFFKSYGIDVGFKRLVSDDKRELSQALQEVLNYDVLITSGGVSMGDADYLPEIFNTLGIKKLFHKVEVKPGKPLWVGSKGSTIVFGLPGNPVSVQVACKIFIEPFLRKALGLEDATILKLPMKTGRKKRAKFDEFFPGQITTEGFSGVSPINFNGSGDITATIYSHGIGLHPAGVKDLVAGDFIDFYPWRSF